MLAHPSNWRIHPKAQQDALSDLLDTVGWVQDVIINQRTGHVLDGHLRVSLAISREEKELPVVYVDLAPEEENLVLASLDPLAAMAVTDEQMLVELRSDVLDEMALPAGVLLSMFQGDRPTTNFSSGATPAQAAIDRRSASLEAEFAQRSKERAAGMIGLTCPDCGADFQLAVADVLKTQVEL